MLIFFAFLVFLLSAERSFVSLKALRTTIDCVYLPFGKKGFPATISTGDQDMTMEVNPDINLNVIMLEIMNIPEVHLIVE